ncbi:hypothetical protein BC828DRAFT_400934 [Blastocladiella britannica]|nr:hypothetical protein BC828DRAFT_400934 [Blastocladiella britannica]
MTEDDGWKYSVATADWLWEHSHSSGTHWDPRAADAFPFAPDWHDLQLPRLGCVEQLKCLDQFHDQLEIDHSLAALKEELGKARQKHLNWLLSRPDLASEFVLEPGQFFPSPHTLEFLAEIVPDFDMETVVKDSLMSLSLVHWYCARNGTSVESLLPLTPDEWETVFYGETNAVPEWWLQLHLAGGHPIFFEHQLAGGGHGSKL